MQQMAKLRQTFNRRVWDLKDKAWETGFHSTPPLCWTEGQLVPWSALIY